VALSWVGMSQAAHRSHPARVKVGEKVGVTVGGRLVAATVIEDRGDLGARGQQVVRLAVQAPAAAEPYEVELPVDWLGPAPAARRTPSPANGARPRGK
jgi:hypothetical protein